jgi:hypothetical protein
MNPTKNPFTLNPIDDIKLLTGRDKFIKKIKDEYISNTESFVLLGGRRAGKTSILKSLSTEKNCSIDYLYWDVSSVEGDSWEFFSKLILKRFKEEFSLPDSASPDDFFEIYFNKKGENGKLVIILDEFEILLSNRVFSPTIFTKLRSYLTKYGNSILTIIVSLPKKIKDLSIPEEEGSGFFNMLHEVYLPLIELDPNDFYLSYLKKFDELFSFKTQLEFERIINSEGFNKNNLFSWVGRNPFLIQAIGFDLFKSSFDLNYLSILRKNQEKFEELFYKWFEKGYFDLYVLIHLYLLNESNDFKSLNDYDYLRSWCFINNDGKINGLAISGAIISAFIKFQRKVFEMINNKENKEFLYSSLEYFRNDETIDEKTFTKPYFQELLLSGLIRIQNNKIIKNLSL